MQQEVEKSKQNESVDKTTTTPAVVPAKKEPKKLSLREMTDIQLQYMSRKQLNLCKNNNCYNHRRSSSAYCQQCSDTNRPLQT